MYNGPVDRGRDGESDGELRLGTVERPHLPRSKEGARNGPKPLTRQRAGSSHDTGSSHSASCGITTPQTTSISKDNAVTEPGWPQGVPLHAGADHPISHRWDGQQRACHAQQMLRKSPVPLVMLAGSATDPLPAWKSISQGCMFHHCHLSQPLLALRSCHGSPFSIYHSGMGLSPHLLRRCHSLSSPQGILGSGRRR